MSLAPGTRLSSYEIVAPLGAQIDAPRPLFTFERPNAGVAPAFDTLDGRRFLIVRMLKPAQSSVVVVQNWFEEFRREH